MGNCCGQLKTSSSMEWGGEDWGSLTSKNKRTSSSKLFDQSVELNTWEAERKRLLGALRASSDENGKVKIRISKKELEDLMVGKIEKRQIQQLQQKQKDQDQDQGPSAEQVLLHLINTSDHGDEHHIQPRQWKPVLQSIPEVN